MTKRLIVVGGGIVGITISIEIAKKNFFEEVLLIEKNESLGSHATSRNSGVIHAGFYYTENSIKDVDANRKYCQRLYES